MSVETLSPTDFAPYKPVSAFQWGKTIIRTVGNILTVQNPLFWSVTSGRHEQADMEGPYYIIGSPERNVADGKAVMASPELLKKYIPFLTVIRVTGPDGKPVPNAALDWWQADSDGVYCANAYSLRGKARTDSQGYVEVLSVPPGPYGPEKLKRAGHFHMMINPPSKSRLSGIITQLYVCDGNDEKWLSTDFINYVRKVRPGNMLHVWGTSEVAEEKGVKDWPVLPADEISLKEKVAWWNDQLARVSSDLKIGACATREIRLKSSWF